MALHKKHLSLQRFNKTQIMQFDIHQSLLGKTAATATGYAPELLFRIPRAENRVRYNLHNNSLPFVGYDVWNCYELSFLNANGLPVSCMLKIVYPAESEYIVESKSLKLYLNAFNMQRLAGNTHDSLQQLQQTITADLEKLLECELQLALLNDNDCEWSVLEKFANVNLLDLLDENQLNAMSFSHFKESPALISATESDEVHKYLFRTDVLRSNCRVTNQPDWGELFVEIECRYVLDLYSVLAYIVSFREENHFHEEVVEMIYKRLWDKLQPQRLMVAATYTRRGGIDINPVRASHADLIDGKLTGAERRMKKTYRQ